MTPARKLVLRRQDVYRGRRIDNTDIGVGHDQHGRWAAYGLREEGKQWLLDAGLDDSTQFARRQDLLDAILAHDAITPMPPSTEPAAVLHRQADGTHRTDTGDYLVRYDTTHKHWKVFACDLGTDGVRRTVKSPSWSHVPSLREARRIIDLLRADDAQRDS